MRLEMLVGYKCNVVCEWCNRAVGLAHFKDTVLKPEQVRQMVERTKEQGIRIRRCTLGGGEPLLNPHLQEIVDIANELPGLRVGRILTNDVEKEGVRQTLVLPKKWHWVPAPIDDTTDPLSGKDAHEPFFISPADHGLESEWKNCTVKSYCGRGFDAYGFSMCGVAATIGRIIGVDPYWQDGHDPKKAQEEICKHCPYGMSRRTQRKFTNLVHRGEIEDISPTFKEGLAKHRKEPMEFTRYGQEKVDGSTPVDASEATVS